MPCWLQQYACKIPWWSKSFSRSNFKLERASERQIAQWHIYKSRPKENHRRDQLMSVTYFFRLKYECKVNVRNRRNSMSPPNEKRDDRCKIIRHRIKRERHTEVERKSKSQTIGIQIENMHCMAWHGMTDEICCCASAFAYGLLHSSSIPFCAWLCDVHHENHNALLQNPMFHLSFYIFFFLWQSHSFSAVHFFSTHFSSCHIPYCLHRKLHHILSCTKIRTGKSWK